MAPYSQVVCKLLKCIYKRFTIFHDLKNKSEIIQLDRYEEIISGYKFAFDILEEKQYILENNFEIKPNSVLVLELKK